ncbi:hypothetical protein P4H22_25330 [Bacillus cereus]|nr:hypothetical protein [Bacillus thuringiensis]MEB8745621.1 hypothetical protein [Bacillus cereus]MEB9177247.1 hypothetical protein [Bacillus cereus]MEB9211218.1 hypothetical protein [Bacillus cereus]MEB9270702.1 hypothetical protein [Bacillus cereus]MEB9282814.1 hypothetical protein [Bacillus cereus]
MNRNNQNDYEVIDASNCGCALFCASGKYRELQRKVQRLAARFFK